MVVFAEPLFSPSVITEGLPKYTLVRAFDWSLSDSVISYYIFDPNILSLISRFVLCASNKLAITTAGVRLL